MEFRVLGPLEVRDGERSLPLAGAKQRALLALLLVNANRVVSRDRMIDELWGERPPETAVQSLQVYVSRLRKLLPPERLLTRPPGYLLEVEPEELDVQRFERLLAEGRAAAGDPEHASRLLHEALALWRGPPLAEFAFDGFAQAEIGRLEDLRLAAVEERVEADLALARPAELIGELEALVAEHPHRERLRGQLMLALYRSGRQAEALAAYQAARRALVDELGIEPSAGLQRLEKQILTQDEELDLARQMVAQPSRAPTPALERKTVTVLFADLAMADEAEKDPEQAGVFFDRIHDEAAAEIEAAGGTIEKGLAGALLATFGAETARQEDHALRAVSAALAARNRLAGVFGETLSLRMGVASGEVILGRPGSFVTGTPVAEAARLVRFAQPGEVVVGDRAATATAGAFELQQRDGAYVLVGGLAPTRSPAQIARRRKRRRLLALVGGALVLAASAVAIVHATRPTVITVPPNAVGIIDPKTNRIVGQVPVGIGPGPVAVGNGYVWVGIDDDRNRIVWRIDLRTHANAGTVPIDNATPTGITAGGLGVWVAEGRVGRLARIDPQYGRVVATKDVARPSGYGYVTTGGGSVWAVYGESTLARVSPATNEVLDRGVAGYRPMGVVYANGLVWVLTTSPPEVNGFRPATFDQEPVIGPFSVGEHPVGIAYGYGALWVANGEGTVSRIDPTSRGTRTIDVGGRPTAVATGAGAVWVTSADGKVFRIDPAQRRVVKTIDVGNPVVGVAAGGGLVWFSVQAPA